MTAQEDEREKLENSGLSARHTHCQQSTGMAENEYRADSPSAILSLPANLVLFRCAP